MDHPCLSFRRANTIFVVVRGSLLFAVVAMFPFSLTGCIVRGAVYPAPGIAVPEIPPPGVEEVRLEPEGGGSVVCWWHHDESLPDTAPILLFLHGNGENLETMRLAGTLERLVDLQVHVLALDYPGYGRSGGAPSERSVEQACDAALVWMGEHYPHSRRVVCGWSLGAAAAISVAARNPGLVDGLVAMSAWTNLADVAARFYPRFLVRLLVRDRYNSLDAVRHLRCPLLLVHGKNDRLIPVGQGEQLRRAAPTAQRWVVLEGSEHNDLLDNPVVWAEIRTFLRTLPPKKDARLHRAAPAAKPP